MQHCNSAVFPTSTLSYQHRQQCIALHYNDSDLRTLVKGRYQVTRVMSPGGHWSHWGSKLDWIKTGRGETWFRRSPRSSGLSGVPSWTYWSVMGRKSSCGRVFPQPVFLVSVYICVGWKLLEKQPRHRLPAS